MRSRQWVNVAVTSLRSRTEAGGVGMQPVERSELAVHSKILTASDILYRECFVSPGCACRGYWFWRLGALPRSADAPVVRTLFDQLDFSDLMVLYAAMLR